MIAPPCFSRSRKIRGSQAAYGREGEVTLHGHLDRQAVQLKFSGPLATTSNRDFLALAVLGVSEMSKLMNIDNVIGQFLSSQKMTTMTAKPS